MGSQDSGNDSSYSRWQVLSTLPQFTSKHCMHYALSCISDSSSFLMRTFSVFDGTARCRAYGSAGCIHRLPAADMKSLMLSECNFAIKDMRGFLTCQTINTHSVVARQADESVNFCSSPSTRLSDVS